MGFLLLEQGVPKITPYLTLRLLMPLYYCHTGKALDYILRNNFKPNVGMRADSQKTAVLITDGESNDDILLPSQNLKDTGIEVYAIGD